MPQKTQSTKQLLNSLSLASCILHLLFKPGSG